MHVALKSYQHINTATFLVAIPNVYRGDEIYINIVIKLIKFSFAYSKITLKPNTSWSIN